ncbi:MAG: metallophosphoesterase family protein [Micavibrio sp.]
MKIIHLSDLHFGTENDFIVDHLRAAIRDIGADLVIVSGDFTQIASHEEFIKTKLFLESLEIPFFCVPGNHDIPRYHPGERVIAPYYRYKKYISPVLCPVFENQDIVIAGLNSARRILPHWNWAHGAVSPRQIQFLKKTYADAHDRLRVCVLHHPLHRAEGVPLDVTVFGGAFALNKIIDLNVHLVLSGHVHFASTTLIQGTVFASASTALSTRLRNQENGFNLVIVGAGFFEIIHFTYNGSGFCQTSRSRYDI